MNFFFFFFALVSFHAGSKDLRKVSESKYRKKGFLFFLDQEKKKYTMEKRQSSAVKTVFICSGL